jgi:basic membrane protein A and related proteins
VIRAWLNDQAFCTTAEGRGVRAIGEFTDASSECPKSTVTSLTMNFAPFFEETVGDILEGNFKPEQLKILPVKGVIEIGEWGPEVSNETKQQTEQALEELGSGKLYPWEGPIEDQNGQVKVKKGEKLSQKFIYNEWEWFVNGVQ